ncbi:MAG: hypothetical protein GOV15_02005, partial [Candidatus Diapherotrites archaeon]|nr:hypothetical protein [Candidatus Diapherotrites archaeon]
MAEGEPIRRKKINYVTDPTPLFFFERGNRLLQVGAKKLEQVFDTQSKILQKVHLERVDTPKTTRVDTIGSALIVGGKSIPLEKQKAQNIATALNKAESLLGRVGLKTGKKKAAEVRPRTRTVRLKIPKFEVDRIYKRDDGAKFHYVGAQHIYVNGFGKTVQSDNKRLNEMYDEGHPLLHAEIRKGNLRFGKVHVFKRIYPE